MYKHIEKIRSCHKFLYWIKFSMWVSLSVIISLYLNLRKNFMLPNFFKIMDLEKVYPSLVTLTKVKYYILETYWKYTSKVYLKHTSSILETYFKYTSSILEIYFIHTSTWWITEEEVYFKSILFQQKKYIWSTFCEIKSAF